MRTGRVQCSVLSGLAGCTVEHPVGFLEPGSTRETGRVLTRETEITNTPPPPQVSTTASQTPSLSGPARCQSQCWVIVWSGLCRQKEKC